MSIEALLPGQTEWTPVLINNGYRNNVRFPNIQPLKLKLKIETRNLLRLTDLEWTTSNRSALKTSSLSLYAREGETFRLYLQPRFGQNSIKRVDPNPTRTTDATPRFELPASTRNPLFNPDFDGDGVLDTQDLCPEIADATNADIDQNGLGDACEDPDQDGLNSNRDNCPFEANRDQIDSDQDGAGDACDATEDRLTEQSNWWINLSFGVMILALLGLVGRSALTPKSATSKPKKKPSKPKTKNTTAKRK